jgi:hypothetical protein
LPSDFVSALPFHGLKAVVPFFVTTLPFLQDDRTVDELISFNHLIGDLTKMYPLFAFALKEWDMKMEMVSKLFVWIRMA